MYVNYYYFTYFFNRIIIINVMNVCRFDVNFLKFVNKQARRRKWKLYPVYEKWVCIIFFDVNVVGD